MRTMRAVCLAAAFLVTGAACGDDDVAAPPMILIGTDAGPAVLDGGTGVVGAVAPGAVASPDGEVLVQGDLLGTSTTVRAVEVATGVERWSHPIEGSFGARTTSVGAARVALTPLPGAATAGTLAPGRSTTELVVVEEHGEVDRYEVDGNIEPEAFSLDGSSLFVVQFLPAELPTTYQVRRLDLATGALEDVFSVDAELQHAMEGYARTQVWLPDGSRLYTLYTQQVGPAAETVAFVHVLDLEEQWAHCVGLPAGFSPSSAGLALADGGDEVVVADVLGGVVAVVDSEALETVRSGSLRVVPDAGTTPVAVDGDEVLIGAGASVLRLDRSTLEEVGALRQSEQVVGLQPSTIDDELYLASNTAVLRIVVTTGEVLQRTAVEASSFAFFTSLGGAATPQYSTYQCAC